MLDLFKQRGFAPYLIVLFLNAFVDLGHKIIVQNTVFKAYDGQMQIILTAIVNALILLPFVFLFVPAGFVADKYPKQRVMQISAWFAVGITLLITFAYYQGWFWFSFAMTFLLAVQSAIYAPAKYGYIKELVGEKRLVAGNGAVQAGTMIAILSATFVFSMMFESLLAAQQIFDKQIAQHIVLPIIAPLGWILVGLSLLELISAYQIPQKTQTDHEMKLDWWQVANGRLAVENIQYVWRHSIIWLTIVGLAILWSVAQVILATFPTLAEDHLQLTHTGAVQGIIASAGVGIMLGALLVARLSKQTIELGLVPIGALGFTLTVFLVSVWQSALLQAVNFLFMGMMASFFIIPLRALMQYHSDNHNLGRIIASNNLIQNLTMLSFLVITILLSKMGMDSLHFFWLLAFIILIGACYTIYKLPQSLIRFVVSRLITSRYRIHVLNFERIPANGGILLLGNHISWLDWAMVQIACPRKIHFVITKVYYHKWYLKRFLDLFGVVPIGNRASAESLKMVAQLLREGKAVCLFPEGTISHSGQLNEFKRGYELIAEQVDQHQIKIVPFYLHGLWGSRFSHSGSRLRDNSPSNACKGWKRDLIVAFGNTLPIHTKTDELKYHITELSLSAWQRYADKLPTIPQQWLYNTKRRLSHGLVCEATGSCLNAHRFMVAVFHFAKAINERSPERNIGVLLPSTTAGAITNMAILSLGKTVVNLNYTASENALQQAVEQAEIRTIYTSKKFLHKLNSRGIDIAKILPYSHFIYLEDVKPTISKAAMAWTAFLVYILPASVLAWLYLKPVSHESVAAILFSSGSEGAPKGIKLSHKNLAANARQVVDVLNPHDDDKIVSTLPTFHAFGLLATTLMPLSQSIPIICHPDPTDVLNIAKGIARFKATYLFGTSTFFRMYVKNKKVHPLMLASIRLTIAGAEKLNPEIREAFQHKFNKIILEGYGATETSPVASVNLPDFLNTDDWRIQIGNRYGTVGQTLPGTSFRIVDPTTLNRLPTGEDGLILIAGPQVMKGYLNQPAKTANALVELDGFIWYKTGDKGHIDHDGFLTIVDRYSRFAKVAGEMVSLTAVEQTVRRALKQTDLELLAVNLPDSKKGETIILLLVNNQSDTNEENPLNQQTIKQALINSKANPLMHSSQTYLVDAIPKLGSGKTDFSQAKKLALTLSAT